MVRRVNVYGLNLLKCCLLGTLLIFSFCASAHGQNSKREFSDKTGQAVMKAIKAGSEGKTEKALSKYIELLEHGGLNPYETSTIYQLRGGAEVTLKKYDLAVTSFQKAIDGGGFSEAEVARLAKQIEHLKVITQDDYVPPTPAVRGGYFKINPETEGIRPATKPKEFNVPEILSCDTSTPDFCYQQAIDLHYGKNMPKDKAMAHAIFTRLCEQDMGQACHTASMAISRYSQQPDYEKYIYFQTKGCKLVCRKAVLH